MTPLPQGLTTSQAEAALQEHGPNLLSPPKRLKWLRRLGEVLREPTLLVLVLVFLFYLGMGSTGEALLLGSFVLIVIAVTYVEEARTEAAVAALSALASPRALALRDGHWTRVPGIGVVPGDLLNINEGDRIPADAEILESHDLKVDESLLSGESQAVWKVEDKGLYAGCLVVQGQALAKVTATGLKTRMGKISRSLSEIEPQATPFQKSVASLVRLLAWVAAAACLGVIALSYLRGASLSAAVLQGLTLAIATVPEELPVILAVFMAMGARRLSAKGVLALHVPAVETLGAVTLLAVDKTGTLTRNEMRLHTILPLSPSTRSGQASEGELLRAAAEASELEPFDPMERRILERSGTRSGQLVHEYELSGRPPRMGHVWRRPRPQAAAGVPGPEGARPPEDELQLSVKGAVEGVLEHCLLDEDRRGEVLERTRALASQGMRVLGVASGTLDGAPPETIPGGLKFLGLLGFEDPLREGVKEAIATARRAGMRVVMMTGDSPETARAVATELDLDGGRVALGEELDRTEAEVLALAAEVQVFARMAPEHKLILVQAWSRQGEVVGMTGDGVNDAPALTRAHVGVALGAHGTDVAREAADLVLTDDSFNSLVEGVRLGRSTTRRILRAALFVLAVHVPIIGIVLGCLILGLPPMIEAAQIAFLELFIGPTCSVVFERAGEDTDVMGLPPRDPAAPLLSWKTASGAIFQGLLILAAVFGMYLSRLHAGAAADQARSEAFFTLLAADFMLCWTMLSKAPWWRKERWNNAAFWVVTASVLGALALLLRLPLTAGIFHMAWLGPPEIIRGLLLAASAVLWIELFKLKVSRGPIQEPGTL